MFSWYLNVNDIFGWQTINTILVYHRKINQMIVICVLTFHPDFKNDSKPLVKYFKLFIDISQNVVSNIKLI
jgi:hypothetical protein